MSTRKPDPLRRRILALLQQTPPATYEQIRADPDVLKMNGGRAVSAGLIRDVKEEAGLPVERRARPSSNEDSASALDEADQEGDGMTEFQPPPRPKPSERRTEQRQQEETIVQSCPCGTRWALQPNEQALDSCPACRRSLAPAALGAATPADPHGRCAKCGGGWILEAGEQHPRTCPHPHCGVRFA